MEDIMEIREEKPKTLALSILSLSLLTVMAAAAVAPAMGTIKAFFSDASPLLTQMVISTPALFIVITNLIFPHLCKRMGSKTLVLSALLLYTIGGCLPGLCSHIVPLLCLRALVGIAVGILMPLATGLLAYHFPPSRMEKLMGYSSAFNCLGGIIAVLIAGFLSNISWRASFLVYLMGLIGIVLCLLFLPNDRIRSQESSFSLDSFKKYYRYVVAVFLLMVIFFVYPTCFAVETLSDGIIPQNAVTLIMSAMNVVGLLTGLSFGRIKGFFGNKVRLIPPTAMFIAYFLLGFVGGWVGTIVGTIFVGIGLNTGMPFIISSVSKKAGRSAAATALPMVSAFLYSAQFLSPFIISGMGKLMSGISLDHPPFVFAWVVSIILWVWLFFLKEKDA